MPRFGVAAADGDGMTGDVNSLVVPLIGFVARRQTKRVQKGTSKMQGEDEHAVLRAVFGTFG